MPIDSISTSGGRLPVNTLEPITTNTPVENPGKVATGGSSTNETISLSETARQSINFGERVAELPVVDTEKVEAAQAAIAANTFELNSGRTADNIINFEGLLPG